MKTPLRADGDHVLYVVEKHFKKGWSYAGNASHFAANIPAEKRWDGRHDDGKWKDPWRDFTACGECWKKTGVHGTFDPDVGMAYVAQLTEHNPGEQFRLAEVRVSQKTMVYKGDKEKR